MTTVSFQIMWPLYIDIFDTSQEMYWFSNIFPHFKDWFIHKKIYTD